MALRVIHPFDCVVTANTRLGGHPDIQAPQPRGSFRLGELRHHCREVWGIDVKDKGDDSSKMEPHSPEKQRVNLLRVYEAIRKGSKSALAKIRKGYVVAVAEVNGVLPTGGTVTKAAYVSALLSWVCCWLPSRTPR